jgi:catechol 2,3-dioxygenase-like lactoylglutathione lyase family enzyme
MPFDAVISMKIESLGHLVLKVRDIDRAVDFYTQVLGFREGGRTPSGAMVFFAPRGVRRK